MFEDLAWEVAVVRDRAPAPSAAGARLRAAFGSGLRAGALPGILVFAIYFGLHHELAMPWAKMAGALAAYAPAVGISLAVAVELAAIASAACARRVPWLPPLTNPPVLAGLAGAIAGIAPGAVGVVVFGGYRGPFVGTALIAIGASSGALLVAIPAARRARVAARAPAARGRTARPRRGDARAIALALIVATLALGLAAAIVTPLIVQGAFVSVASTIDEHTALVGGVCGALGGAVLGLYNGTAIALARIRPG